MSDPKENGKMDENVEKRGDGPAPNMQSVNEVFPPKPDPQVLTLDIAPAAILKVVLTLLALKLCFTVWIVFVLIAFALLLTAAFNPIVRKLQARVNRTWAVLALVLTGVGAVVGLIALLVPPLISETSSLIQHAPQQMAQLDTFLQRHHFHTLHLQTQFMTLRDRFASHIPEYLGPVRDAVQDLAYCLVTIVLSVYLLIEGPRVGNALSSLLPRSRRLGARRMVAEMGHQVGGYVRGQLIASVLAGTFSFVLLFVAKVPNSLALGALAAIMDVIPMIGILIATVAAVLMALTVTPGTAIFVFIAYLIYHQVESHIIVPS
nr:AI-2E family transporter [Armatimonadota bacterium]